MNCLDFYLLDSLFSLYLYLLPMTKKISDCEHCSCLRNQNKRCCYCHKEMPDDIRIDRYLRSKTLRREVDDYEEE